jgi:glycosyltransferase involved in cell wall biosynthesis
LKLTNYRKGGDLLLKILQSLPASLKAETVLLIIGHGGKAIAEAVGMETFNLGFVSDDQRKAIAYSAADLFLFPTRADIFGLVSIESQACGTPVVAFGVGGVPEHVQPGLTGYLAEPENIEDFRDGVLQLLEDESLRHRLGEQGRAIALEKYRLGLTVQRYIQLYSHLLHKEAIPVKDDLVSQPLAPHAKENQ